MENSSTFNRVAGYIIPNLFAFIVMLFSDLVKDRDNTLINAFFWAEFTVLPILMGIGGAWFWRHEGLHWPAMLARSASNLFIAIGLSFVFLGEGIICLIIVSPLLYAFIVLGAFIGRAMFKRGDQNLNVSIIALLIILYVVSGASKPEYVNEVSDTITINAPVAKVWPLVVAYDYNTTDNKYWLFKAGLPSPVQSTVAAYKVGAGRKCIFSNGYAFDERIVTYDENHNLTFDITHQPRDPEIMGHIDIMRGQFLLRDNGNGTTTVTGNSWYKLYVAPVWYYDIWAKSIVRNVHIRVMEHVKMLSERRG